MLTPGEDKSSPTGTMLSPSSVPNGKKLAGTAGSVRQLTDGMSPPTSSRKSGVDVDIFVVPYDGNVRAFASDQRQNAYEWHAAM